jgi:hypothetical protein
MAQRTWPVLTSLREFTELIDKATEQDAQAPRWYRGSGECGHDLLPSLFHGAKQQDVNERVALEGRLLTAFQQRSVPFLNRNPVDEWEWLFLMQHYRLPTRLLDWTENPFVALYFALTKAVEREKSGKCNSDSRAAVWLLRPAEWNAWAGKRSDVGKAVLTTEDVRGYAPQRGEMLDDGRPLAISGVHSNVRITAQRGAFVVFGRNVKPMNSALALKGFPSGILDRVDVPIGNVHDLLRRVTSIGITDSLVYPDLEGLAKELRRTFGLEV